MNLVTTNFNTVAFWSKLNQFASNLNHMTARIGEDRQRATFPRNEPCLQLCVGFHRVRGEEFFGKEGDYELSKVRAEQCLHHLGMNYIN